MGYRSGPLESRPLHVLVGACLVGALGGCVIEDDSCVAEGTGIRVPGGERRIEELQVGDAILALDPSTGETIVTQITAIRSARRECVLMELGDGGSLRCTPNHPLFDPDARVYAPASDWVEGRRTRLLRIDGQAAEVTSVIPYVGLFEVFDLTVASEHHNFVAAGYLVHNKSPACEDVEPNPCIDPTAGSTGDDTMSTSSTSSGTTTGTTTGTTAAATDTGSTGSDTDGSTGSDTDGSSGSDTDGSSGSDTDGSTGSSG